MIVLLFKGVWGVYAKYKRASNTMDNTQIEFNKVDDRYNKLQNKVDYLGTEFAQEEAMRERFDVIHPGEEVIKLVNKEVQVQEVEIVEKKGFWKKVGGLGLRILGGGRRKYCRPMRNIEGKSLFHDAHIHCI